MVGINKTLEYYTYLLVALRQAAADALVEGRHFGCCWFCFALFLLFLLWISKFGIDVKMFIELFDKICEYVRCDLVAWLEWK